MDQALRAQVADDRLEITVLRDEFADFHLGTANHCLWNSPRAECRNQLPDRRGQASLPKRKLSKPQREQVLARLAEVRSATAQFDKMKENA